MIASMAKALISKRVFGVEKIVCVRSCIMPGLSMYWVQELNAGTVLGFILSHIFKPQSQTKMTIRHPCYATNVGPFKDLVKTF